MHDRDATDDSWLYPSAQITDAPEEAEMVSRLSEDVNEPV
jgi:hypothetical protein